MPSGPGALFGFQLVQASSNSCLVMAVGLGGSDALRRSADFGLFPDKNVGVMVAELVKEGRPSKVKVPDRGAPSFLEAAPFLSIGGEGCSEAVSLAAPAVGPARSSNLLPTLGGF